MMITTTSSITGVLMETEEWTEYEYWSDGSIKKKTVYRGLWIWMIQWEWEWKMTLSDMGSFSLDESSMEKVMDYTTLDGLVLSSDLGCSDGLSTSGFLSK